DYYCYATDSSGYRGLF
nr:immunoglobulin light chain junction region [Macaca mulatta]MOV72561.1 immunoglobulin light chain junction region [Macaca mulatta]MOV73190.1 immunoglobulin light chain junction region [Macaca mulatta]